MIAFGVAIGSREKYERYALPAIEKYRDPDAPILTVEGSNSIFTAYNELLDRAEQDPRIEAIVLLHEDTEIRDVSFESKVRWALMEPRVAVVGTIGSVSVEGIDWWVGSYGVGSTILSPIDPEVLYETGMLDGEEVSGMGSSGEVDMVDGYLMVLSRWAIKTLRFDEETLGPGFHAYDADICFQARELGRSVIAVEMDVAHHRNSVSPGHYREDWIRAQIAFRRKWERRGMLKQPRLRFPPYNIRRADPEEKEKEAKGREEDSRPGWG